MKISFTVGRSERLEELGSAVTHAGRAMRWAFLGCALVLGCGEPAVLTIGSPLAADGGVSLDGAVRGDQGPAFDAGAGSPDAHLATPDAGWPDQGVAMDRGQPRDAGFAPDQAQPVPDQHVPEPDQGPPIGETLPERLRITELELGAGVHRGVSNWRIWGRGDLGVAPTFTLPLPEGGSLIGLTTRGADGLTAWALHLDALDQLITQHELARGLELRGLAAEPDGHFGALLWDDGADTIQVTRFDAQGAAGWTAQLTNPDNRPDDFGIGDSRLEFGGGRYGAYYHVHSDSGHEGDTLKWIDAATGTPNTGWGWGCSHSMSNLLRYNPALTRFAPICVTDCFPGTPNGASFSAASQGGIYLNHRGPKVMDVAAGCNGSVAGEIGSAAIAPDGWKLVFNAHQAPLVVGQQGYDASMNQDVGFSAIGANLQPSAVVWLTQTGLDEADTSIARWTPSGGGPEQYVVGWSEGGQRHQLSRVDAQGALLEGPVDVSATARWGRRDDPFRRHANGDVQWVWFDRAGSTTLKIARLRAGR